VGLIVAIKELLFLSNLEYNHHSLIAPAKIREGFLNTSSKIGWEDETNE
jgi:hypothetical protein